MKKETKAESGIKKVSKIFGEGNLPPLFGTDFSKGNLTWRRLEGIEFENIGRILTCHLLIENYINKIIELRLSKNNLDIDEANLNFMQKLKLIRNDHAIQEVDFYQGVTIINKIRNKYSHNIDAKIEPDEIGIIESIIKSFEHKHKRSKISSSSHTPIAIIEAFTSLFCAYTAGYCSALVEVL